MDVEVRSFLRGAGETRSLGKRLGSLLKAGDWVALTGDLGSGKTTLVSAVVEEIHPGLRGRSPTYVMVEVYGESPAIVHADLYRLETSAGWSTLGIEDLADFDAVVLVEWADRALDRMPPDRLDLALRFSGEGAREIRILPHGERWCRLVREGGLDRECWSDALRPRD
jgi:tRNA threonylcarbamoyl adenosine modification protein YjeE